MEKNPLTTKDNKRGAQTIGKLCGEGPSPGIQKMDQVRATATDGLDEKTRERGVPASGRLGEGVAHH